MLHVLPADCADCSNKIFVTNCYGGEPLPYGIKDYRIIRHKWTNILKIKVIQEWRSLESSSYGNEIWDEIMSFGHWSLAIGYCILVIGHRISPFWVEKLESLDIWKVWNVWTDLEYLKVWTVLNVWGSGQSAYGLLIKHFRIVILPICKTCVWNFWTDLEFVEFWTVWNECNWIIASAVVPIEIFFKIWDLRPLRIET